MACTAETTINLLPDEVILIIFEKLAWPDLLACSLVSKAWFDIVERSNRMRLNSTNAFWHYLDYNSLLSLLRTYRNVRVETIDKFFLMKDNQPVMENCWDLKIDMFYSHAKLNTFLSHCKALKSLSIFDPNDKATDPVDKNTATLDLGHVSQLTTLSLDNYLGNLSFDISVPKMRLRNLMLTEVKISDEILQKLIKLSPHLESLELCGISRITAEAFAGDDGLGTAKWLHTLVLPASAIDNRVVEKMQLPRLRKLWLLKQKGLKASGKAIRNTLAMNCPLLLEINGTGGTPRYKRDILTQNFVQLFQDDDTASTVSSTSTTSSSTTTSSTTTTTDFDSDDSNDRRLRRIFSPLLRLNRRNRYYDSDNEFSDEINPDEEDESNEHDEDSDNSNEDNEVEALDPSRSHEDNIETVDQVSPIGANYEIDDYDHPHQLPEEVMSMIFRQLPLRDFLTCSLVSKAWFGFVERTSRLRLYIDSTRFKSFPQIQRSYRHLRFHYILFSDEIDYGSALFQTTLENCHSIVVTLLMSGIVLPDFLIRCKNLKSFNIIHQDEMIASSIIPHFDLGLVSHLMEFRFVKGQFEVLFENLVQKTEIRTLKLFDIIMSDESMQQLIKLSPHLESLDLNKIRNLTCNAFTKDEGLGAAKQLHTLALPARLVNDAVLEKMQLPRLRQLWLFKQKELSVSETAITNTLAKNCPMLMEICGKIGFMVRFERDTSINKFHPVFQGYETETTNCSDFEEQEEEEEDSWESADSYDRFDGFFDDSRDSFEDFDEAASDDDDISENESSDDGGNDDNKSAKSESEISFKGSSTKNVSGGGDEFELSSVSDDTANLEIDQSENGDEIGESDVNAVYEVEELDDLSEAMDIGANYVVYEMDYSEDVGKTYTNTGCEYDEYDLRHPMHSAAKDSPNAFDQEKYVYNIEKRFDSVDYGIEGVDIGPPNEKSADEVEQTGASVDHGYGFYDLRHPMNTEANEVSKKRKR